MSYAHLSQYERYQIQHLHHAGCSSREIAEQVDGSPVVFRLERIS
jgi:IS30 family transposase